MKSKVILLHSQKYMVGLSGRRSLLLAIPTQRMLIRRIDATEAARNSRLDGVVSPNQFSTKL